MKSLLIAATLLFLARIASAQTPYWQPVDGPFENVTSVSLIDSQIVTKIGASYYSYDSHARSWKAFSYKAPQQVPWPRGEHKDVTSTAQLRNDTAYFSSLDSVFLTTDFGFDWKYVGSFGSPIISSIKRIFELPSGATIIQNSLGTLYYSYNAFRTLDSGHVLNTAFSLTSQDTLFYVDQGRLYRSDDVGKHWQLLQSMTDTISNRWSLRIFPQVYLLNDLHGYLAYSRDGGRTFKRMTTPKDSLINNIQFGDTDRFYGLFYSNDTTSGYYRSDDWGQTWKEILYNPSYINTKDGALYTYGGLRSSDHGDSWDMLTARGLIGVPLSMESFKNKSYLSTDQGIYVSSDHGGSWSKFSSSVGELAVAYGQTLTVNTVNYLDSNGNSWHHADFSIKQPGIGALMDSGVEWVADRGQLHGSIDAAASFFLFSLDFGSDLKNIMKLTGDTALIVYKHAVWKVYDLVTGTQLTLPSAAKLTGGLARDSTGAIYLAMTDGSLLVSHDRASTWQTFPSPVSTTNTIVTTLTAGRAGMFWAITQDTNSRHTRTYLYDATLKTWSDVTASIPQTDTTIITNIWYVNDYVYAGTSDMGLYRSVKSNLAGVHTSRQEQNSISLSPNPVTRSLVISYEAQDEGSVSIIDVTGRELVHELLQSDGSNMTLDCSTLAPGMYFARISSAQTTKMMKFIKQ